MSPKTQAKVLRVLQEQEVERLGSARDDQGGRARDRRHQQEPRRGDLSAASSARISIFRLNVIPIVVPPLRERRDDIPPLVQHFARLIGDEHNMKPKRFDAAAMDALSRYRWRGNIRELRNTVERVLIMAATDVVHVDDLPAEIRGGESGDQRSRRLRRRSRGADCRRTRGAAASRRGRRHPARIQGRRRTRVPGTEAPREQLEHLEDRRSDRHAAQQSLQEARTVRHQAGDRRLIRIDELTNGRIDERGARGVIPESVNS